jgi:phytoene desaturase
MTPRLLFASLRAPKTRLLDPERTRARPRSAVGNARAPHAIVIGAGFGGLAAAVRLLVRGYRVTVIDRLDQAGGRARVFRQDGFVFDAGPTVITAPFLLEELWSLAGRRMSDHVTLVPVDPFYRIRFHDGAVFDYCGDSERMREQIRRFCVRDVEGWERLMAQSERIYRIGFEALAHAPFTRAIDMARVVPDMVRLESWRTVHGLVAKYVQDERLRQVFSFSPLLVGGNPYSTSSIYALIPHLERRFGVWFAMGGTGEIVRGLVALIEELGGQVRLGERVDEIVVEGGRARGVRVWTPDGERRIAADLVVSNADSAWTYRRLVAPQHRRVWTDHRLERLCRYSMSLFVWYFGTRRVWPDVAHHTILLGPRYRELLEDIFERKVLAEDFSLYLHRPTRTDPSMAPPGHDAFYVLSPVPNLESGIDWRACAEPYRAAIEAALDATVLPGLSGSIVSSRVLTPEGFLEDYLSFRGAAFGLEPVLHQSAYFRPHNESEDVRGLYLVGAGTHPGAGVPGVLSSARVLDSVVPDPERLEDCLERRRFAWLS